MNGADLSRVDPWMCPICHGERKISLFKPEDFLPIVCPNDRANDRSTTRGKKGDADGDLPV